MHRFAPWLLVGMAWSLVGSRVASGAPEEARSDAVSRLAALVERIPAERYDVAALAASLGEGPEPSFAFVRDRIRYEPYRGVVRGAEGTLAAGSGNAYDRAALLAALLQSKGMTTRFATARLSLEKARQVMERAFAKTGGVEPVAPGLGLRAHERAQADFAALEKALGSLPGSVEGDRSAALRDASAHAWIEAQVDGRWIALDPTLAEAVPGAALVPAERTLETFGEDVRTRLTVRIATETLSGSNLRTETRLQVTRPLEDWYDRTVLLHHVAPAGLASVLATAVSGAAADSLLPLLTVDGQTFVGSPIAYAAGGKAERGQPPRGGLGGAFGPGGALGSRDAFVAEWLEIEITPPGGPTETLRRSLLDRAGPAWRASAAHDAAALASIQRCQGKPCAVAGILHLWISVGAHDLRTWVKAAHRAAWLVQAHASTPKPEGPAEAAARVEERVWVEAMRTFTLPWLGDELARRTLDDDPDVRVLLDGPRIALVGTALAKEGDRTLAQTTTDLVRDRVRALSRTAASDGRALERKVRYGLLQGALEHELLAEDAASVGAEASVVTTSGQAAQGALFTMLPKDAASTSTVFSGADAALRAREALEAGATLVVAEASRSGPSASWWRVDADGQTTAVLDGLGGGRALGWVSAAGPDGVVPQEDPGLGGHRPPGPGPKAPSSPPSSRPPPPSGPRPADQIGPRRPGDFPRGGRGGGGGSGGGPGGGGGGGEEEGKRKGGGNEYMAMVKYVTIAVFVAAAIGIGYYIGAYTTLGERMAEAIDSGTPSAGTTPTGGGPAPPR